MKRCVIELLRYDKQAVNALLVMTGSGRKRTLVSAVFRVSKRPLSGKADIQPETLKFRVSSGRYTPESGHSVDMMSKGRQRPKGDIQ